MSAAHGRRLSSHVAMLGCVSMLTAMSSAMIYSLLPGFPDESLGASVASAAFIKGLAEAANSFFKVFSGRQTTRSNPQTSGVPRLFDFRPWQKFVSLAGISSGGWGPGMDPLGKGFRAPRGAFLGQHTPRKFRERVRLPPPLFLGVFPCPFFRGKYC